MNAFGGGSLSSNGLHARENFQAIDHLEADFWRNRKPSEAIDTADWARTVSRLTKLGVSSKDIGAYRRDAHRYGSTLTSELIAKGLLNEVSYYKALAAELGVAFMESLDPNALIVLPGISLPTLRGAATVKSLLPGGASILLTAPDDRQLAVLARNLRRNPGLRETVRLTTRSSLDHALFERMAAANLEEAVFGIKNLMPSFSASLVATGMQGILFGILLTLLPLLAWRWPSESLLACHAFASFTFAACILMRVHAASRFPYSPVNERSDLEGPYPVYTVIVAVYKEAAVVPQLVSQLMALNWPASRLEILIACEASDVATIELLRKTVDTSRIQIVVTTKLGPQTKPRALSFALRAARGEFVVIYDAEDRPHPDQLMEAYQRFQSEPETTACLQAPLIVTNRSAGFLARMFSFEYAALFGGLLPYLSSTGRLLPLGGTSNHFRRSALLETGAWDPFNVTEDADLGTRLCRLGYGSGMISRPTLEDAPTGFRQWRPQRVRWFKGWLQTWLVHMRSPRRLLDELGPKDFCRFQLLTIGMVLSALVYPSMLAVVVWGLYVTASDSVYGMSALAVTLFAIDFSNIILGHLVYATLGAKVERSRGLRPGRFLALCLPLYWTLLSVAAWGAFWELIRKPHHWNKTEHFPTADLGSN
jgi:cellulose synthase/poly-beta-1,6-N-acetylglucosamine synthase-like glycosyltransferase